MSRDDSPAPRRVRPGSPLPWLLMAAAVFVAALALGYTLALSSELTAAQQAQRDAERQTQQLRAELDEAARTADVVTAPDVRRFELPPRDAATGVVYLSPSRGLVLRVDGLPALDDDLGYELWIQPQDAAPVSLGMLDIEAGAATHFATLPDGVTGGEIRVTVESAGGTAATPSSPPVLLGVAAS